MPRKKWYGLRSSKGLSISQLLASSCSTSSITSMAREDSCGDHDPVIINFISVESSSVILSYYQYFSKAAISFWLRVDCFCWGFDSTNRTFISSTSCDSFFSRWVSKVSWTIFWVVFYSKTWISLNLVCILPIKFFNSTFFLFSRSKHNLKWLSVLRSIDDLSFFFDHSLWISSGHSTDDTFNEGSHINLSKMVVTSEFCYLFEIGLSVFF